MLLALDPQLARRVGAITLSVLALAGAGFVFLAGQLTLGAPIRFRVMFRHSAGLIERAPFVVGGAEVGRIAAISPVSPGAPGPLAGAAGVAVTVEVSRGGIAKVPGNAAIFVAMRGALSDRYLELAPPAGAPAPPISDGAELRGIDPPTLDDVIRRVWVSLTTFQQFTDTLRPELSNLLGHVDRLRQDVAALAPHPGDDLADLADAARGLLGAARTTWNDALGGQRGGERLGAVAGDARRTIAQLRSALDALAPELGAALAQIARVRGHVAEHEPALRAAQILAAARQALAQADAVLATATELAGRIGCGEGSIGGLMTDPSLPEAIKDLTRYLKRHPWQFLARPLD